MFTPEEQQVQICLLQSNLKNIASNLEVQNKELPALNAENHQKYLQTIAVVKTLRSLDKEIERLKLEDIQLQAKRTRLKTQSEDIAENMEIARQDYESLAESLKEEHQEIEMLVRKYEDSLAEKAEKFRKTHRHYYEEDINTEIEEANTVILEHKNKMSNEQRVVDGLREEINAMDPDVPDSLLEQIQKLEMNENAKQLTEKLQSLEETLKSIKK